MGGGGPLTSAHLAHSHLPTKTVLEEEPLALFPSSFLPWSQWASELWSRSPLDSKSRAAYILSWMASVRRQASEKLPDLAAASFDPVVEFAGYGARVQIPAVGSRMNYFVFLCLSFLICKVGITVSHTL